MKYRITDRKFLKYVKNTCLDFENSNYTNNEIQNLVLSMKDILKTKKLTLINSSLLIKYLAESLDNETTDYKEEWFRAFNANNINISFNEYLILKKELKKEWSYMYKVFDRYFEIDNNYNIGMVTINYKYSNNRKVA